MRGGTISARAEMWPAATGLWVAGRRRLIADGAAVGGGRAVGGGAATARLIADGGDDDGQRKWSARENETARGVGSALKHLMSDGYGLGRRT